MRCPAASAAAHLLGRHAGLLQSALDAHNHALALWLRLRHVVRIAGEGAADELGQDGRPARLGVLQLLQYQHSCRRVGGGGGGVWGPAATGLGRWFLRAHSIRFLEINTLYEQYWCHFTVKQWQTCCRQAEAASWTEPAADLLLKQTHGCDCGGWRRRACCSREMAHAVHTAPNAACLTVCPPRVWARRAAKQRFCGTRPHPRPRPSQSRRGHGPKAGSPPLGPHSAWTAPARHQDSPGSKRRCPGVAVRPAVRPLGPRLG